MSLPTDNISQQQQQLPANNFPNAMGYQFQPMSYASGTSSSQQQFNNSMRSTAANNGSSSLPSSIFSSDARGGSSSASSTPSDADKAALAAAAAAQSQFYAGIQANFHSFQQRTWPIIPTVPSVFNRLVAYYANRVETE